MERSSAAIFVACLFALLFALVAQATTPQVVVPSLRIAQLPAGMDPPARTVTTGAIDAATMP